MTNQRRISTTTTKPLSNILGDDFMNIFDEFMDNSFLTKPSYPPYNIWSDDKQEVLEIATAGFHKSELDISLEHNKLIIKGNKNSVSGQEYRHKGIAARDFTLTFATPSTYEVESAEYVDGILTIVLKKPVKTIQATKINIA